MNSAKDDALERARTRSVKGKREGGGGLDMDGGGSCVWIAKTGEMRFVLLQRPSRSDDKQMKQS